MKVCRKCHIEKEDSGFRECLKNRDGLRSYCKECDRKISEERRRKRGIPPMRANKNPLPKSKQCNKCKAIKDASRFRVRLNKNKYLMLNSICMECELINAKEYYERNKSDEEFKRKNRERAKAYKDKNCDEVRARRQKPEYLKKHSSWEKKRYGKKREEIAAKMKIKRQTPDYKNKMRAYREKNKDKIYSQEVVTKKRYAEKHRDNVTDEYVIRQLVGQGYATRESLQSYPEIIEAKRLQILIKRQITKA